MKITIITVVYNNKETIEDAIKSVLNQSYKNVEYIVIDGGSTDGTLDVLERYKNDVSRIISEPDGGIYEAMNKGILIATGQIIGLLNSDDIYADNKVVEDIMSEFEQHPKVEVVFGNLDYVRKNDINKVVRRWRSREYYSGYFDHGNVPPHPTFFVRSSVYEKVGLFETKFRLASDYEFMLRTLKKNHCKSKYFNRLIVKMRLGGATNRSFKNILNGNREILLAWKDNGFKAPFLLMPLRIKHRLLQFLSV